MESFLPGQGKPQADEGKLNLYKARMEENVPYIVNPLSTLRGKEFKAFHVRHEASMLELFFDLCFVANLSTFTTYHEITTSATVFSYVGFFLILWSTWFQITIFDVRFASDSVYERCCKLYQLIAFVMFAASGAYFAPGDPGSEKLYLIYQIMSVVLGITRFFLATQYIVVAFFVVPKYQNLRLPFLLIITTYVISGTILLIMYKFFGPNSVSMAYVGWWIILPFEAITILAVSSHWRELSFKESHINERLSLLTLIIIGEGAIGLTKMVGILWPTDASPGWGVVLVILSVTTILFLLWDTYFDCKPHGDFGTIKQQWWALSHFFLHLGYVGVVEGSNRMAAFYPAVSTVSTLTDTMNALCLQNPPITTASYINTMNDSLVYYEVMKYQPLAYDQLQGNFTTMETSPSICADANYANYSIAILNSISNAIMAKLDIKPANSDDNPDFFHTFRITYAYFFGSIALTLITSVIFLHILRRQYHDRFEYFRIFWRLVVASITIGMIFLYFNSNIFLNVIGSPFVDLIVCFLMASTLVVDRFSRVLGLRRFRQHYATPILEPATEHHDSIASTFQSAESASYEPKGL